MDVYVVFDDVPNAEDFKYLSEYEEWEYIGHDWNGQIEFSFYIFNGTRGNNIDRYYWAVSISGLGTAIEFDSEECSFVSDGFATMEEAVQEMREYLTDCNLTLGDFKR